MPPLVGGGGRRLRFGIRPFQLFPNSLLLVLVDFILRCVGDGPLGAVGDIRGLLPGRVLRLVGIHRSRADARCAARRCGVGCALEPAGSGSVFPTGTFFGNMVPCRLPYDPDG